VETFAHVNVRYSMDSQIKCTLKTGCKSIIQLNAKGTEVKEIARLANFIKIIIGR